METKESYNIKVLQSFDVPWYYSRYKIALRGMINFGLDSLIIKYSAVNNIAIEKISKLDIKQSGIFGSENWISISFLQEKKSKTVYILSSKNGKQNTEIISRLKQYL